MTTTAAVYPEVARILDELSPAGVRRARVRELTEKVIAKYLARRNAAGVHREPWSGDIVIPVAGNGEYLPVRVPGLGEHLMTKRDRAELICNTIVEQLERYYDAGKL